MNTAATAGAMLLGALFLLPFFAAAVVLLAEPVGLVTVAGGALVVGGVALVQRA